ncbi:hypothetical protein ACFL4T_14120, partial [candidate division KSB1 bacterium]
FFVFCIFLIFAANCSKNSTDSENFAPTLSNLSANRPALNPGESTVITAEAVDGNGDAMTFSWSAEYGDPLFSEPSSNRSFTWTSPDSPGTYFVNCTVSDGEKSKTGYLLIPVGDTIRIFYNINSTNPLPPESKLILEVKLKKIFSFTLDENFDWELSQTVQSTIDSNGDAEFEFINRSVPTIGGIMVSKFTVNDGLWDVYENTQERIINTGVGLNVWLSISY